MDVLAVSRARVGLPRRAFRVAGDERLVAQVRAGSQSAFEAIYDRHHAGILSFCRHMVGTREEAEDVVQHTFVAAYQALLADDREIALKAWLYTIARNRCLSVLRARREHVGLDDAGAAVPATAGLAAEVERRDDLRALLADLAQLPDDQRAALILAELSAHSHHEIAAILGVPTAKVKALVFQAREALVNRRVAREVDCASIREQLTVVRGGARRRKALRLHVAQCEGCRAFDLEIRNQRARLAVLLPVAPTLALKHGSLTAAFALGPGGAAAVGGGGAGVLGGGTMMGAKILGTKAIISLAVTAAGGGYVAVHELRSAPSRARPAHTSILPGTAATAAGSRAAPGHPNALVGRGGGPTAAAVANSGDPHPATPAAPSSHASTATPGGAPPGGHVVGPGTPAAGSGVVPATAPGELPSVQLQRPSTPAVAPSGPALPQAAPGATPATPAIPETPLATPGGVATPPVPAVPGVPAGSPAVPAGTPAVPPIPPILPPG